MERDSREWLVPLLTGVGALVVLIVGFGIAGEPKGSDNAPSEIQQWYQDNKDAAMIGAFVATVGAVPLVFFGAYLRKVLEPAGAMLSILPVIGLAMFGVGVAIDNMLLFAAAEAADTIPAPEVQVIQAIWDQDFLPLLLGVLVFLWSVGIAVLRSDVLPKWLGWLALAFGVVGLAGPISFVGGIGAGLWVIIASIVLSMRARKGRAQPAAA
jgi:hypothetical protein